MDSIDFENDDSIKCKTYSMKLKRNTKNISLILIYHSSYEVIEIQTTEIPSNKLLGRAVLTYSDIFEIFENFFLCFNENMLDIYTFLNNCFVLKKYKATISENTKQIAIKFFFLKEGELEMKTIYLTSCQDRNEYEKVLEKIKVLNQTVNSSIGKNCSVAPVNCVKYENDKYFFYFDIFFEKEIDVLGIKAHVFEKNVENNINYFNDNNNIFYSSFYFFEEFNSTTKKYYQSIVNLEEISKEIMISFYNNNIRIEEVSEEKMKIKMKFVSSTMSISDIDFILFKNASIKEKYLEIIKSLKMKNEYLIKKEIYQDEMKEEKNKNNNSNILCEYTLSDDSNIVSIGNSLSNSNFSLDNKILGKKIKRDELNVNKVYQKEKKDKNKKGKKSKKEINSQEDNENDLIILREKENKNQNKYNELYQQLIKNERLRLANISEHLDEFD